MAAKTHLTIVFVMLWVSMVILLAFVLVENIQPSSLTSYPSFLHQFYKLFNDVLGFGVIVAVPILLIMGIVYPWRYIVMPSSPYISKLIRKYLIVVMGNVCGSFMAILYALLKYNNVDLAGSWQLALILYACLSVCLGLVFMSGHRLWKFTITYAFVFALISGIWLFLNLRWYMVGLIGLLLMHLLCCFLRNIQGKPYLKRYGKGSDQCE